MNGIVRFYVNQKGHVNLQQLHTFDKNPVWENVPVKGFGETESLSIPLGINCGIFFIEEKEIKYVNNKKIEIKIIFPVSALSITKIAEHENKTRIELYDKRFYFINMNQIDFLKLMVTMLSSFKIININRDGIITNL